MHVVYFEQLGLVIVNRKLDFIAPKTCSIGGDPSRVEEGRVIGTDR